MRTFYQVISIPLALSLALNLALLVLMFVLWWLLRAVSRTPKVVQASPTMHTSRLQATVAEASPLAEALATKFTEQPAATSKEGLEAERRALVELRKRIYDETGCDIVEQDLIGLDNEGRVVSL